MAKFGELNEYQRRAVECDAKIVLVNSAVGSGKTTVLTHKIAYLCEQQVAPQDIAVLSFTRKAAREIQQRLAQHDQSWATEIEYCGTFHSVASRLLREFFDLSQCGYDRDFAIVSEELRHEILDELRQRYKLRVKNAQLQELHSYTVTTNRNLMRLQREYTRYKQEHNLLDFNDLIHHVDRLLDHQPLRFVWVVVDEFQDTNARQASILKKLIGYGAHLFAVGDPNQTIYSWRGSYAKIFDEFAQMEGSVEMQLPVNYRSTATILDAARGLLGTNSELKAHRERGKPIVVKQHHNSFHEATYLAHKIREMHCQGARYSDIAILYRRQSQRPIIEDVLLREKIPFIEQATDNPDTWPDAVLLLTLHSSKGLQFPYVFIVGANKGNIPLKNDEIEEERRLFFVGVTRAEDYVEISYLKSPDLYGCHPAPSPYLQEFPEDAVEWHSRSRQNSSLQELVQKVREQRYESQKATKKATHDKYGTGVVLWENDDTVCVEFPGYGEKSFSRLFCPLQFGGEK